MLPQTLFFFFVALVAFFGLHSRFLTGDLVKVEVSRGAVRPALQSHIGDFYNGVYKKIHYLHEVIGKKSSVQIVEGHKR